MFGKGIGLIGHTLEAVREKVRIIRCEGDADLVKVAELNLAAEKLRQDLIDGDAEEKGAGDGGDFNFGCLANKFNELFDRTFRPSGLRNVGFESGKKLALFHFCKDQFRRIGVTRDKFYNVFDGSIGKIHDGLLEIGAAVLVREKVIEDDRREEAVIVNAHNEI